MNKWILCSKRQSHLKGANDMKKVILASVLGLTLNSANTTSTLVSAKTINNSIVDLENYKVIEFLGIYG